MPRTPFTGGAEVLVTHWRDGGTHWRDGGTHRRDGGHHWHWLGGRAGCIGALVLFLALVVMFFDIAGN